MEQSSLDRGVFCYRDWQNLLTENFRKGINKSYGGVGMSEIGKIVELTLVARFWNGKGSRLGQLSVKKTGAGRYFFSDWMFVRVVKF